MPAINVAKTDTFEVQRQKINQIGSALFGITQGGSDLSTGLLRLGDGTLQEPSLSYISDTTLGFYKPFQKTLGIISNQKSIINFSDSGSKSLTNFTVTKNSVSSVFSQISNVGSGYDTGTYQNVLFTGGSGSTAAATITVDEFLGSITTVGSGYTPGDYTNIQVIGGSGVGTVIDFTVIGLEGIITSGGSGYTTGTYPGVSLTTTGSGSGATADIQVADGKIAVINIVSNGSGYTAGDTLSVNSADVGGTGSGFVFTVTTTVGELSELTFSQKGAGYSVNDVLTIPNASTISTNLTLNSAEFTVTPEQLQFLQVGQIASGSGIQNGSFISNIDPDTNIITLSKPATATQTSSVTLTPVYGDPSTSVEFTISSIGSVSDVTISDSGYGYSTGDILSANAIDLRQIINYDVTVVATERITFETSPTGLTTANTFELYQGRLVDIGFSGDGTFNVGLANQVYLDVSPSSTTGSGTGATFDVTRDSGGNISSVIINKSGKDYAEGDELTIPASSLGGTTTVTIFVNAVTPTTPDISIYKIEEELGYFYVESSGIKAGDTLRLTGTNDDYVTSTVVASNKYFLDDGSGAVMTPDLTFFVGNKYSFSYSESTYTSHPFKLSKFRDGVHPPSNISNLTATLSTSSNEITVSDSTGILVDMEVIVTSGAGQLPVNTRVSQVNGNTITLSSFPSASGFAALQFSGYAYTPNVESSVTNTTIFVTETTPQLYYYCEIHPDMGGDDNIEATITIDPNNPIPYGSGFSYTLTDVAVEDVVTLNASTGNIDGESVSTPLATITTGNITTVNSTTTNSNNVNTTELTALSSTLNLNATTFNVKSDLNFVNSSFNNSLIIQKESGNIETSGIIKSTLGFNSNDILTIVDNEIESITNTDIILTPFENRIVKINTDTALIIPSGTTLDRPVGTALQDGAIRFNVETNQYEGYNSSTTAWSSLGGVRDLDNNTYIIAEQTVGANDNKLWFYNDDNNTYRFELEYQTFYNSKKIRSLNTSAPIYTNWTTNTPVIAGQYLKYKNDIYLVINGGTTGTSGNEPNDTSGNTFLNGSATLQYSTTAVAPLTFEEISEVRIAPLGGTSLSINNDLRLSNNNISTDISDVLITPALNRKAKINTKTSLVIPVGTDSEKGSPEVGSIRYNTTINQFEGFNGSLNWTSLGGVRDVDGNTYIVPESAPGANENILYFYNDNNNTLRVTTNQIELDTINTISSPTSDILNLNASLLTVDSLSFSIDNTDETRTFLSSTRPNLDLGISSGLLNETVLRIENTGDVYYNIGYASGTYNGVRIFDKNLKNIEIADFKITTTSVTLVKGTLDTSNTIIYNPALSLSAKVLITVHNLTTGDKEFFEYSVMDTVNDVFYTEYGNIKTGADLITATFSVVPTGIRLSYTLNSTLTAGDNVVIKIISQITKR